MKLLEFRASPVPACLTCWWSVWSVFVMPQLAGDGSSWPDVNFK